MPEYIQGSSGPIAVRKVKQGQIITEPGIYDMPMIWYHDNCCDAPSISSSGLRKIRSHSPAHYWCESPLNPAQIQDDEEIDCEAVRVGRAAHTLLLEPTLFKEQFKARPGAWDSWRTKEAKAWRADQTANGVTVMSGDEMIKVAGIANSLREHPLYEQGLLEGDIERALIWKDEKSGVWLKARPDVIPRGSNIFADLKCLRDVRTSALERAVFEAGYDMQMALAGIGMEMLLGRRMEEYVLVPVENVPPYGIRIAPIAADDIGRARLLLRWSIDRFAACLKANRWPSFEDDDNTHIHRRPWDIQKIEDEIKHGMLPGSY